MGTFDVLLVHVYLLAIFSVVVKTRVSLALYRLLTVFVVFLMVISSIVFFRNVTFVRIALVDWARFLPLILVFIVIVQGDLKLLFKMVGIKSGLLVANEIEDEVKDELMHAIDYLSRHKIGAIITFERSDSLKDFIDSAFRINASVSSELLTSMFIPNTPLHDGAVIVKDNVIVCAGAYFPPSESDKIPKYLGSRHRAAIGISEISDSFTVVVSEETGQISVSVDGYLDQDISTDSLILYMEKYLQN